MPKTIMIRKSAGADRVRLNPSPLEAVVSNDKDSDGRFRVAITAEQGLQNRPGPDKSVTFDFLNDASRDLFEVPQGADGKPIARPFKLNPGETLTLTLKQTGLRVIAKRAAGEPRFVLDAQGHPSLLFTLTADFRFINPKAEAGHGHSDLHLEC